MAAELRIANNLEGMQNKIIYRISYLPRSPLCAILSSSVLYDYSIFDKLPMRGKTTISGTFMFQKIELKTVSDFNIERIDVGTI
ncbi:MAG: hypothetical protein WAZ77_20210 [Candidatus Nitrosopolaris sp.]